MFKTGNLYQNDAKWKNVQLGKSPETIGSWGGLLTSMTMMLNGIGYDEKGAWLEEGGSMSALIQKKCADPAVRARRVTRCPAFSGRRWT